MQTRERIAVDVGNSRVKVGHFGPLEGQLPVCRESFAFSIADHAAWTTVVADLAGFPDSLSSAVVAGSNQHGVDWLVASWPDDWPAPVVIRSSRGFPIHIDVEQPHRVGLDRILNAVAGSRLRAAGQSCIIVDCGTATTVDVVSHCGAFSGGAILPGCAMSARALNSYTEALPLVDFQEHSESPAGKKTGYPADPAALGRNTRAAIQSGVFWGQVGAIRELISRLSKPEETASLLILTGGGSSALLPFLPEAIHCPQLSLQGLLIVADENDGTQYRE